MSDKWFNKNYDKAKKIIEEANRNIKYCYGPTGPKGDQGPTGPQGPATIEIGNTETGDPDTEAVVTNVGTNTAVVLNFKIPSGKPGINGEKGEIGPTGPIGPRGLPGEIGISEVITIDGTETVEPDELAEVQDDFDRNIHHLTFYIPKGEKGDIGPTGPAGKTEIIAYAERYLTLTQDLKLQAETDTVIPLNEYGSALFANYDTENSIDIKESGFYQISYFFSAMPKQNCTLTISAKDNDLLLPASNITTQWQANNIGNISNTIITALSEGDILNLNIRATTETDLAFNGSTSAVLSIVKIH